MVADVACCVLLVQTGFAPDSLRIRPECPPTLPQPNLPSLDPAAATIAKTIAKTVPIGSFDPESGSIPL
ncbi:hypothetical protein AMR42_12495 [Limnothrix sp. PR1529]|nr:hypothetical protein BCR12_18105 [Limnothrix sp. P13C2]PIB09781.1 hypothetical protein AMR42_12495 [Limnothrix sp. PR1529]